MTVDERPLRETVEYVGTVRSDRTLRVTARVPGTLDRLPVEEGDRVESGQLLARVDAPELEAKFEGVEAELRRAKTERDFLCDTYETDRRLHESGALPASKLDGSRKRCTSGKESVAAARAKRHEIQQRLAKRRETSPIDGVVLERRAEPGEHVGPGRPLLVLADHTREVVVPVVESDLTRGIDEGTPVRLQWGRDNHTTAAVSRVDVRSQGPARAIDVHIPLPDEVDPPRIGGSIDVAFVLAEATDARPVPRDALVRTDKGWAIFVADGDTAHRRPVERDISKGNWVAVRPKLEPGTRVVVTNLATLRDEMPIYTVETTGGDQ